MELNAFTIFATLVNFVILIVFMKHFLFDKVNNAIESRTNDIKDTIDRTEANEAAAAELKESFNKQIATLESKGRDIVKDAKVKADGQAEDILREAGERANALLKQTESEIERLKRKALDDMKKEIGSLAILAAEKILEKQLDHEEQQAVIGKIIDDAENAKWQN
ncbi:MAG: F0F1 ATP synthase subunit B [Eubacteriales bacterium]|nr:F0F1 ATP synthase subunit B [Eubacteriales bacterium]MDD3350395.1 F0F1 ATP synthase subunit B [Eubacteriales bacterium]